MSVLLVLGCTNDDEQQPQTDVGHEGLHTRSVQLSEIEDFYDYPTSEFLHIPKSLPKEYLSQIYTEYALTDLSRYMDSISPLANLMVQWNWSTIDIVSEDNYLVTIPVVNSEYDPVGFILLYNEDVFSHFTLLTVAEVLDETSEFTNTNVDDFIYIAATKLAGLNHFYGSGTLDVHEWVAMFQKNNVDRVETRNWSFDLWYDAGHQAMELSRRIVVRVECDKFDHRIGPGGGGHGSVTSNGANNWWDTVITTGGGSNNNGNNTNNDNDEEEDSSCKDRNFSQSLLAYINNLGFIYPCMENVDDIIAEIKEALCDLEGSNLAFAPGAVGGTGELGVEDLLQLLDIEDFAWEEELDDEYREYVAELKSRNLVNPCNPGEDVVDAALALMEDNGGCGIEDLDAALVQKLTDCNLGLDDEDANPCEIALLFNPLYNECALYLVDNRSQAFERANTLFGSNGGVNGCGDAFRHAYFNALNTLDCGVLSAKVWGDAHECGQDQNDSVMDLSNNAVGIGVASLFDNPQDIEAEICDRLANGGLRILADVTDANSALIASTGCSCY